MRKSVCVLMEVVVLLFGMACSDKGSVSGQDPVCDDGVCEGKETCSTCPADCICSDSCGNQNLDQGELCDGELLNDESCTSIEGEFVGGELACNATCDGWDTTSCITDNEPCGNENLDQGELCDGELLNDESCTSIEGGFTGGELACNATCDGWDTTSCIDESEFDGFCILPPWESGDPELPRQVVDTQMPDVTGSTLQVNSGDDLQAALNQAQPGDEIVLEAGATFSGQFELPAKSGADWIIIRSSAEAQLPGPTQRVSPADAHNMPRIQGTSSDGVIMTAAGAHHYRLIGIEVVSRPDGHSYGVLDIGDWGVPDPAQIAHHFVLDRLYVHNGSGQETRRGIAMNVAHGAVINSHVGDFYEVGSQSQAILGINSPGPLRFVNNYLSAASEVIMFGGAENASAEMIPADIEICHNTFFKPAFFNPNDSDYPGSIDGRHHFESKFSKRVLLSGNIMLDNNNDSGFGYAIALKANDEYGGNPWTDTSDYTIAYNYIKNSDFGVGVVGDGDGNDNPRNHHVKLVHNLLEQVGGRLMQIGSGIDDMIIVNNTVIGDSSSTSIQWLPDENDPVPAKYQMSGFRFNNNIFTDVEYPMLACCVGSDIDHIVSAYFSDTPSLASNVMVTDTSSAAMYQGHGIDLVSNISAVGFVDAAGGNFRLSATSAYQGAGTDGEDYGANIDDVSQATGEPL